MPGVSQLVAEVIPQARRRTWKRALPVADFIEINESCPNVHHGGGGGGGGAANSELRARLQADRRRARRAAQGGATRGRRVPILVKLGDLGEPRATVRFLSGIGVDGVVALAEGLRAFALPDADRALLRQLHVAVRRRAERARAASIARWRRRRRRRRRSMSCGWAVRSPSFTSAACRARRSTSLGASRRTAGLQQAPDARVAGAALNNRMFVVVPASVGASRGVRVGAGRDGEGGGGGAGGGDAVHRASR